MEPYERQKLADAFREVKIMADEKIIVQGDLGTDLFFLQDGQAYAKIGD